MEFDWLWTFLVPVIGHVLYGLPPDPADARDRLVRLHNGDDFSPEDEPPHPDRLQRVRGVSAEGSTALAVVGDCETGVAVDASGFDTRPAWVVVETPRTFIELPAQKFDSYLTHEGLMDVLAARAARGIPSEPGREIYSKYIKTALCGDDGSLQLLTAPVGLPIEIVPVSQATVRIGDVVEVAVLRDGIATKNVQVRVSHRMASQSEPGADSVGRTDNSGRFSFRLHGPGYWRLHTISMSAVDREGADWESKWASLTIRV